MSASACGPRHKLSASGSCGRPAIGDQASVQLPGTHNPLELRIKITSLALSHVVFWRQQRGNQYNSIQARAPAFSALL